MKKCDAKSVVMLSRKEKIASWEALCTKTADEGHCIEIQRKCHPSGVDWNKESVVTTGAGGLRHCDKGIVRRLALSIGLSG